MSTSPASAHTLRMLNLLGRSAHPVSAASISRQLEIPRSTTYRLLATLVEHDFVTHVGEGSAYSLGVAAYELAWGYQRQAPLRRLAGPVITRLVGNVAHTAHLSILHGKDVIYIIEERAPGRPSLVTDVGVRLPAEVTASGRAMLAHLTRPQFNALYPTREVLVDRTGTGPRTITELRQILSAARRQGFGQEVGAVTAGLASVAVAVTDRHGYPAAAVAVTFDREDVSDEELIATVFQIRRATSALHAKLGFPERTRS